MTYSKKFLSLTLAGVVVAVSASAPMMAEAKGKSKMKVGKLNVTKYLHNKKGMLTIKDLLKVTMDAMFQGDVTVDGDLTVGGKIGVENVNFSGTADLTSMDTTNLVGGEVYYNTDDSKLYLWNGDEWVDLAAEGGDSVLGSSITSSEIVDDTIVAADIATSGVGSAELAADSVGTSEVANDTLAAADLAADSVGSSEIAADAVGASELADDAVVAANIDDATITNAKMVNDTLDFDKIDDTPSLDAATVLALGANNLDINLDSTGEFAVQDGGADVLHVADDTGVVTLTEDLDATMGAAENVTVDAAATDHTGTAGVLDVDIDAGNAAVDGLNIDLQQADGAAAGTDATAAEVLLTADDADANMFGLTITGAATTNAAAASYEAGIKIHNAENTAGSMTDALVITATTATGTTDAVDASDSELVNALNIGDNTITGTTGVIDLTDFDVSADGLITVAADDAGTALTLGGTGITTDIALQNGETIDNDTNGTIALGGAVTTTGDVTVTGNVAPEAAGTRNLGGTSAEWAALYLDDDTGLNFGLDQDALLAYDETTDDRVELTGTNANLYIQDRLTLGRTDLDVDDNGGGTAASGTLTPTSSFAVVSCSDGNGCDITLSETGAKDGDHLVVVADLANASNFADTPGVSETTGSIALGQWDVLTYQYVSDRWVQTAISNN